jgi:spore maturation protein CgeB
MEHAVVMLLRDRDGAAEQARRGIETIRARHSCAHRVDELLAIVARLDGPAKSGAEPAGEATR